MISPLPGRKSGVLWTTIGLAVLGSGFLLAIWPRLNLAFGYSHDGTNGAVWSTGGRAIVEDGLVRTRLGASPGLFQTYAHHPPGMYLESAAAYVVGHGNRVVARMPAVLGSLAAIGLIWMWLRMLGRSRLACFVGLACMVISPMFLLYGPMLNHEAVTLPWACAALVILARAQRGEGVPVALAATVGGVSALLAWQGLLLVALVVATLAVPQWRPSTRNDRRVLIGMGVGAGIGLALTVAAQIWAYGGLREVIDTLVSRTGGGPGGEHGFVDAQLRFAYQGFAPWVLLLAAYGTVLVVRNRREFASAVPMYGAVAGYALVFNDGAAVHAYWNMWAVVLVALGVATVVDRHRGQSVVVNRVVLAIAVVVLVTYTVVRDTKGEAVIVEGARAGEVLAATDFPADQREVLVYPLLDEWAYWISYETRRPFAITDDLSELERAADADPDAVVLMVRRREHELGVVVFDRLNDVALSLNSPYETVRVADLVDELREIQAGR